MGFSFRDCGGSDLVPFSQFTVSKPRLKLHVSVGVYKHGLN